MAAIVNARDALLQAANPRVIPVNLPSQISVPVAQVPGLPDYISAAKAVVLSAPTQLIQINKNGTISPTSIQFTSTLKNIVGTPTWSVSAGTATLTTNPATPNTATLQESNMTSDTATVRATVTVAGTTYYDEITVVKVREGVDSISSFLTNEAHTLQADSNGTVASFAGASSQMKIFVGIVDVTNSWSYSGSSGGGVTYSVSAIGLCTVTAMSADSAYIDITASKTGFTSITKRFTLTKSRSGANGTNGSNGSNGTRGTVQVVRNISGASWSNSEAASAIAAGGHGSPINRDIVTLVNTGASYAETRFYDYGSWLTLGAYVNGNMVVDGTFSADRVSAGTLTGSTIQTAPSGTRVVINGPNTGDINSRNRLQCFEDGTLIAKVGGGDAKVYGSGWGTIPTIYGNHNGGMPGVAGHSSSGAGVDGLSSSNYGVRGHSGSSYGGYFTTNLGTYSAYFGKSIFVESGINISSGSITGNFTIAASKISGAVDVAVSSTAVINSTAADLRCNAHKATMQADGNFVVYKSGAAHWSADGQVNFNNTYSDRRLKKNIKATKQSGLAKVLALRVVDFFWKKGAPVKKTGLQTGFISQEVAKVIPEAAFEEGGVHHLNRSNMIPYLVKAIQELHAEIEDLKARLK
jgi:hypothetical protein